MTKSYSPTRAAQYQRRREMFMFFGGPSLTSKRLVLWQDVLLLFTPWLTKLLLSTSFRINTPNANLAIRAKAAAKNNVAKTKPPTKDSSPAPNPKSQPSSSSGNSSSRPRGSLTPAERDHRAKHNLCMYCGKSGHTVQDCANAPNPQPPDSSSGSASVSNFSSTPALMYPVPTGGSETGSLSLRGRRNVETCKIDDNVRI